MGNPSKELLVIREGVIDDGGGDPDFVDLLRAVWDGRWLIIWSTVVAAVLSVALALLLTEWFRAEATVIPAEARSVTGIGGTLGGLAALAGVSIGGETAEATATLKSRELAAALIDEFGLLHVFFEDDWDGEQKRWRDDDPEDWPDIRDAIKFFHEEVLDVSEDRETGVVTVAVEWTDAEAAAEWATALVRLVNDKLRQRALEESERNIAYLRAELEKAVVLPMQQSIGSLLETELQKSMLARGNDEFAFRVIDAPVPPKERSWPRRPLVAVVGTTLGGLFGLLLVYVRNLRGRWIEAGTR